MKPALMALLLVAACGYTDTATVDEIAALSPLQVDPAGMAVALQLPSGLAVPEGGAKLTVTAVRNDTGQSETLTMALLARPGALANLPETAGQTVTVYRLSDADVNRLRALQAEVAAWKAETPPAEGSGTLGLGLSACATAGGLAADARGAAWVQMQADGGFLPLIPDTRLRDLLGPALFGAIAPCDGPT